jgi:hypothetical protein
MGNCVDPPIFLYYIFGRATSINSSSHYAFNCDRNLHIQSHRLLWWKKTDDLDEPVSTIPSIEYTIDLKTGLLPRAISITFSCVAPGTNPVTACRNLIGVDRTSHGWYAWKGYVDGPPRKADRLKVMTLHTVNGSGAVRIQNYSYTSQGDEDPYRRLGFCLIAPNGAPLYGGATVDKFSGRHKSVEREVMQLLRSSNSQALRQSGTRTIDQ